MTTKSLAKKLSTLWENAAHGKTNLKSFVKITEDNVTPKLSEKAKLSPNEDYFQVRLNQVYLEYQREWFAKYDPMVLITTEFLYGGSLISVPFLVGPNLFENQKIQIPTGSLIYDTRVAGIHPYKGGRLNIKVILYKIQRENTVRKVLDLIENTAGVIDFSTALSSYLKLADVLIDGIEGLLGLGKAESILAFSKEFDPEGGDLLRENYYALLGKNEKELKVEDLWVIDNRLCYASGKPYTASDFVLFSIKKSNERTDIEQLSFYKLWEQALQDALVPDEGHWKLAKANLVSLYQAMILSHDLTTRHASKLREDFIESITKRRKEAVELSLLGQSTNENVEDYLKLLELETKDY